MVGWFFEKKSAKKNCQIQVFQNPQRTTDFCEFLDIFDIFLG